MSGIQQPEGFEGATGINIAHGLAKDVEVSATIPLSFEDWKTGGLGDVGLAMKYRFVHQSSDSLVPDVSFNPGISIPAHGRFGSSRVGAFLPLWAEKDTGPWSVFGGGGYAINPAPGGNNFWQASIAAQRTMSKKLTLGAEIYHQSADSPTDRPFTGVDAGFSYRLIRHWTLLGSAGPIIENTSRAGRFAFYLALEFHY